MHDGIVTTVEVADQGEADGRDDASPYQEVVLPRLDDAPEPSVVSSDVDLQDGQGEEGCHNAPDTIVKFVLEDGRDVG